MLIYGSQLNAPIAIADLLKYGLDAKLDKDAIASLEGSLTWRDLDESSTRL